MRCGYLRRDKAPATRKRRTESGTNQMIIVQIPDRCLLCAWPAKHQIYAAVAVEVTGPHYLPVAHRRRAVIRGMKCRPNQVPDHSGVRRCIVKEVVGLAILIEVRHRYQTPPRWQS